MKKQTNQPSTPIAAPVGSLRWRIERRWRRLNFLKKCMLLSLLIHLLIVLLMGLIVVSEQVIVYVSENQMTVELDAYSPQQREARSRLRSPLSNLTASDPTRNEAYQSQRQSAQRPAGRPVNVRAPMPRTSQAVRSRVQALDRQQRTHEATELVAPREVQLQVKMPDTQRLAPSKTVMSVQPNQLKSQQRRAEHRQRRPRTLKLAEVSKDASATSMAALQTDIKQTDRQTPRSPALRSQPIKTTLRTDRQRPLRVAEQSESAAQMQQSQRQQSSTRRVAINVRSVVEAQQQPAEIPPLETRQLSKPSPTVATFARVTTPSPNQESVSVELPRAADARQSTTEPTPQSAADVRMTRHQRADRPTRSHAEPKLQLAVRSAASPASSTTTKTPTTTGRVATAHIATRELSQMTATSSPSTQFTQIKSGSSIKTAEQQPAGSSPQRAAASRTTASTASQAKTLEVASQPAGTTGRSQVRTSTATPRDASQIAVASTLRTGNTSNTGSTMKVNTTTTSHGKIASTESGLAEAQQKPGHTARQSVAAGGNTASGRNVEVSVAPASASSVHSMSQNKLGVSARSAPGLSSRLTAGKSAEHNSRFVGSAIEAAPAKMGSAVASIEKGVRDAVSGSSPSASRLAGRKTEGKGKRSGLTLKAQPATAFHNASLTSALPRRFGPRRSTPVIGYSQPSSGKRSFVRRAPVRLASDSHSSKTGIDAHETNVDALAADHQLTTSRLTARHGGTKEQTSPSALRPGTHQTKNTSASITQAPAMVGALPKASKRTTGLLATGRTQLASQRASINVTLSNGGSKQIAKTESMATLDALIISSSKPTTKRLASLNHKRMPVTRIMRDAKPMPVSLLSAAAISVSTPTPTKPMIEVKPVQTAPLSIPTAALAGRPFDRSKSMRKRLVNILGGTPESESAVDKALAYLASVQEPDGRWSFFKNQRPAKKQLRHKNDMALTGLASLCFLAANHTPSTPGKYQQCITDAIDFLTGEQSADGSLMGDGNMYNHAIANLAIAEAAIMTDDPRYTDAALAGGRYILEAQHPRTGGWRYKPRQAGDTSVLGWQILVLHSCTHLGLKLPQSTHDGATRWLTRVSSGRRGMLAGYMNKLPRPAMTAEAALTRMLLGRELSEVEMDEACTFLLRKHPGQKTKNYYLWYYCSLAMMQMQNKAWQTWNLRIRDYLVSEQEQNGSWQPNSKYGHAGGRVYSTALSTLTLEVYYRYLPMYRIRPTSSNAN